MSGDFILDNEGVHREAACGCLESWLSGTGCDPKSFGYRLQRCLDHTMQLAALDARLAQLAQRAEELK